MPDKYEVSPLGVMVPVHRIDLSSPPHLRYVSLATKYIAQIRHLTTLFDSLLADMGIPSALHHSINLVSRLLLRRVHSHAETAELRGIAKTAGVPVYLLVAFNVVLDLMMGCTSGAARCRELDSSRSNSRMLHFRTLDWGMDPLRSVVVQLDFFRSKSKDPEQILSSSVTYVGYVGVLTGVRPKLSMSLNFRAVHNASSRGANFKFYLHHLLVLLGFKQSISSLLRSYLLGHPSSEGRQKEPATLTQLAAELPIKHSTAAYLVFSDGDSTITLEKDYSTAVVRKSNSFIVMTNHDLDDSITGANSRAGPANTASAEGGGLRTTFADAIGESVDRRNCIAEKWHSKVRRAERRLRRGSKSCPNSGSISLASSKSTESSSANARRRNGLQGIGRRGAVEPPSAEDSATTATKDEIIDWVTAWPTTNECTHFAAVLDPAEGRVVWVRRYPDAVQLLSDQEGQED